MKNLKNKLLKLAVKEDWLQAYLRYCHLCGRSFKTPGARNAHSTLSHNRHKIKYVKKQTEWTLPPTASRDNPLPRIHVEEPFAE